VILSALKAHLHRSQGQRPWIWITNGSRLNALLIVPGCTTPPELNGYHFPHPRAHALGYVNPALSARRRDDVGLLDLDSVKDGPRPGDAEALAEIVNGWPRLSSAMRRAVLLLVREGGRP